MSGSRGPGGRGPGDGGPWAGAKEWWVRCGGPGCSGWEHMGVRGVRGLEVVVPKGGGLVITPIAAGVRIRPCAIIRTPA